MRGKWANILSGDLFEDNDDDQDAIKQALLETNLYLLGYILNYFIKGLRKKNHDLINII